LRVFAQGKEGMAQKISLVVGPLEQDFIKLFQVDCFFICL